MIIIHSYRSRMKSSIFDAILLLLIILQVPSSAQISPGKLSRFHESLEGIGSCTSCHEIGKEPTNDRCLACHTIIQERIKADKGYHSSAEATSVRCFQCHSEHNGREFELIFWKSGRENFDHSLTGYRLEGGHRGLECSKCHRSSFLNATDLMRHKNTNLSRTYLGLDLACLNCHNDEHRDQLGDNCLQCHDYQGWRPAPGFSHDHARYRLTGEHRDLECIKCHLLEPAPPADAEKITKKENANQYVSYRGLDFRNCTPCHRDVHDGRLGSDCQKCHQTSGFKQIQSQQFNHDMTKYPLVGRHVGVDCSKCHLGGKTSTPLRYDRCNRCHQDTHRGQFAARADSGECSPCHTVGGFLPAIYGVTQHQSSRYQLTGSHLAVPCNLCHLPITGDDGTAYARFNFPDTSCAACHRDIHQGQADRWAAQGGCQYCHNTGSWHSIVFDHNLSRFKLEGKHGAVTCRKCHTVMAADTMAQELRLKPLGLACADCHDDKHGGQFAKNDDTECSRCHTSAGWTTLIFDHDRDSRFALHGAHKKVSCAKCHQTVTEPNGTQLVRYKPLTTECIGCHGDSVPDTTKSYE